LLEAIEQHYEFSIRAFSIPIYINEFKYLQALTIKATP